MGAEKKRTSDASAENGGASGGRYHSRTVVKIKCALLSKLGTQGFVSNKTQIH